MIRKITTPEEREKKDARKKVIISIILALIMLFSSAGYFFSDIVGTKAKPVIFNDVKFTQTDYGTWGFSYGGNSYQTIFNPGDTANVSGITTKKVSDYYSKLLYISAEPVEDVPQSAVSEIIKNLGSLIQRYNLACLNENCSQDYPVKNCSSENIIIFKQSASNYSKIADNEKCMIIEYAPGDMERASDAFLFRIMGLQ